MPCTLRAQHDRFALSAPFRIARGVKTAADVITVSLSDGELIGRGEGVPYARYGESVESALAAIEEVRREIERGADRQQLQALLPPGAARNAVDCALWDLEARRSGRDVATLIGKPPPGRIACAITIVIDSIDAMALAAARNAAAPVLKIKVDANDPAAQIQAVRGAAPGATLIVDPNESWDQRLVETMQPVLVTARVAFLEQPVAADCDDWLEGFVPAVPICADEAVHVAEDLAVVAKRYQMVNVKLDKSGGLTAALELARAARSHGLGLMTGCMVCSSLSIAPALHLASLSDYADLDGPLWLKEDRAGGVGFSAGIIAPPKPGFWGTGCT
ncbi:MAG TPA: N-acetyl-D-Glu racemase DgcA [Sphingomicrobium sp.]|nr:N-acetyl-D-Glu racemase DgcA [Sphingomicrobium sp.]